VFGGGGYLVGSSGSGDGATIAAAPSTEAPAAQTSDAAENADAAETAAAPADDITTSEGRVAEGYAPVPGIMADGGAQDASKLSAVWAGRTEFSHSGLSDQAPAPSQVSSVLPLEVDPAVL